MDTPVKPTLLSRSGIFISVSSQKVPLCFLPVSAPNTRGNHCSNILLSL